MTEFEAFERIEGSYSKGLLLLCDHASNRLPSRFGTLGLNPAELERHIAYDIGAGGVATGLAAALGVPAVLSCYSRLLIDPNRGEDDPTLIRQIYDGTIIPGNYPITDDERAERIRHYYQPYHHAIEAEIAAFEAAGIIPAVLSVHTMTEKMNGHFRPWHTAMLSDTDRRMADLMLAGLCKIDHITVGDNEPYDGALGGDTMFRHCTSAGLAHALIEIRQDLLRDLDGIGEWVNLLAPIIEKVNGDPRLHKKEWHGTRTLVE
jgi:predicted N-formylglutamate amidohydrolase